MGPKKKGGDQDTSHDEPKISKPMPWTGEVTGSTTKPRCYGAMAALDGYMFVYGGWQGGAAHSRSMSCFEFGTGHWSEMETSGEPHPGTTQATAAIVGGALILYGGWSGTHRVGTLSVYAPDTRRWSSFKTHGEAPPPLTFHASCGLGAKRLYVHGGNTTEGLVNDLYVLDLNTTQWSIAPTLAAPQKRSSHTATIVNETLMVVFGGRGGPDGSTLLNDVGVFDTTSGHWVVGVKTEGAPPARYGHSATALGANLLVFGGTGEGGTLLNDAWVLDCEKPNAPFWTKIPPEGPIPSPRTGHAACQHGGVMYVFGGRSDNIPTLLADVQTMDLTPISPAPFTQTRGSTQATHTAGSMGAATSQGEGTSAGRSGQNIQTPETSMSRPPSTPATDV